MAHIPVNHPLAPALPDAGRARRGVRAGVRRRRADPDRGATRSSPVDDVLGARAADQPRRSRCCRSSSARSCWAARSSAATSAHCINLVGGGVFLVAGLAMLTLMQTDANLLNFSISTCVVSFVHRDWPCCSAGLYGKVGPAEAADAEERFRHLRGRTRRRTRGRPRVATRTARPRITRTATASPDPAGRPDRLVGQLVAGEQGRLRLQVDRPFQARLTRCAATVSLRGLRTSSHHRPVSATMPTSACE